MDLFGMLIQNKELIKIFYGLMITLICLVIVLKTHKLFSISLHQGIRYFRNAFFFYGIAFFIRYILGSGYFNFGGLYTLLIKVLFEAFLIMAGFFLLYSLLWKRFEIPHKRYYFSSIFNGNLIVFYLFTIIIVTLDVLWNIYAFMFFSQVVLFIFMSALSFVKYQESEKPNFLKYYFLAMVLSLLAWILNAFAALYFDWNRGILINVYLINIIIFLLFLFGVVKVIRKSY